MKISYITLLVLLVLPSPKSLGQPVSLDKSWIKTSVEDFRDLPAETDTSYLRYTFRKTSLVIGFEPTCSFTTVKFSHTGNVLTIGLDQWTIETLTDTTLTIFSPGFKRVTFAAEDWLRTQEEYLIKIGEHNGKPLYRANTIITPRYKRDTPLFLDIAKQDRSEVYNIRKAGTFQMTFVVTEEGTIEAPKIVESVTVGYDNGIISELLKTSKKWIPATFNGKPIQTLVEFRLEFLDSLEQN